MIASVTGSTDSNVTKLQRPLLDHMHGDAYTHACQSYCMHEDELQRVCIDSCIDGTGY